MKVLAASSAMVSLLALSAMALAASGPADGGDRELVKLPAHMEAHMLSNMRDHLLALEEMLAALSEGDAASAGQIAERRLGMSSLEQHGARHIAPFMPEDMRAMGVEMHRASSRFALISADADVEETYEAQQKVYGALQEITAACNACHARYRVR